MFVIPAQAGIQIVVPDSRLRRNDGTRKPALRLDELWNCIAGNFWNERAGMIVEGLVTSLDAAGRLNLAPMGPIVQGNFESLLLRPFQPSTTFTNLSTTGCGVFHVVDSVDLIVRSVVGAIPQEPPTFAATNIVGRILEDCCSWFEFTVDSVDASDARSQMPSSIVHRGEVRPFRGFNRANHALLEAAIIATRTHLMNEDEIAAAFRFLEPAIQKTGDQSHRDLFQLLKQFVIEQKERSA